MEERLLNYIREVLYYLDGQDGVEALILEEAGEQLLREAEVGEHE